MGNITISIDVFLIGAIIALVIFTIVAFVEFREYKITNNLQRYVIQQGIELKEAWKANREGWNDVTTTELQIAAHLENLENVLNDTNTRIDAIEIIQEAHREVLALKPRTKSVKRDAE